MKSNCREQPSVQLVGMEAHSAFPLRVHIYYPPTRLQVGNVFTGVCLSVNLSVGWVGSRLTIIFDALDLTIQSPPPRHWISLYTPPGLTPPGNVQTRSTWILLYRNPRHIPTCSLWHVRFVSRRVASYWNAFLFIHNFESINFTCQIHSLLQEPLTLKRKCPTVHNLALKLTCHHKENWKVNYFSNMTTALISAEETFSYHWKLTRILSGIPKSKANNEFSTTS